MYKKILLSTILALSSAPLFAADYFVVVPKPSVALAPEINVSLSHTTLSPGIVGAEYTPFDFNSALRVTGDPAYSGAGVTWSLHSGELPVGLMLNPNGTITGTPTVETTAHFQLLATYKTKSGDQSYDIEVTVSVLSLSQVSSGGSHSCGVTAAGGVKCWGFGGIGQLGNDGNDSSYIPVDVSGLTSGVASISSGLYHTCAVTTSGGAKCWGQGANGELGYGGSSSWRTPVDVSGLTSGVVSISAGQYHTCAVTTAGGAKCWGYGGDGQLGYGGRGTSYTPVDVSGLTSGVASISSGLYHTCAVTIAGGAKCWGQSDSGTSYTPVDVSGLTSGVASISSGLYHTCAVTIVGGAKCWGRGDNGQLGYDGSGNRNTPIDVSGLTSGVASISAGQRHTCAVTTAGNAKCWGQGSSGQLGNGSTAGSTMPVNVAGLSSGIASISAGGGHTCVVTTAGEAKCWGLGNSGQLGNESTANSSVPVEVKLK